MPRTSSFPPTPAPSTDIKGKSSADVEQPFSAFSLPPAASHGKRESTSSTATSEASDSSYRPLSPPSPIATSKADPGSVRKRAATSARMSNEHGIITKDDYSLPPPPTRSRKIIQMDPRKAQEQGNDQVEVSPSKSKTAPGHGSSVKRKQGATTAQGRKIARKTAHSLIERRRRSKMNEEFATLKDMIPACQGQEMHKLAILQASTDYVRYLEKCISTLQNTHRTKENSPRRAHPEDPPRPPDLRKGLVEEDDDDDEDEEMDDMVSPTQQNKDIPEPQYHFPQVSPAIYPSDQSIRSTTTSPNLYPADAGQYSATTSPATRPADSYHYSYGSSLRSTTSPSIQASPAFSVQNPFAGKASTGFALTSPALAPQPDRDDHEATEALLMLNTDRRGSITAPKRGMSVRDLLSG